MQAKKRTAPSLLARKRGGPKIAVLTAYDATIARLLDAGGSDILLVGDSLGMVVQGSVNTLSVTLEQMAYHTRAVAGATQYAQIVADMPFLTYQTTPADAVRAAGALMQAGAEAVKLEGGVAVRDTVARLVEIGIPVMGHVGLTPQSVHAMGGFKVQGKTREAAERIEQDALALVEAGVYSIVIEGVPAPIAKAITDKVPVPTIGIGAGPDCDGQVLVCYDFLGMFQKLQPKFVKRYLDLGDEIVDATQRYVEDVRAGRFPEAQHTFSVSAEDSEA